MTPSISSPFTPLPTARPPRIVGNSAWADYVTAEVRRIARFRSTVLITGPTGTGKELLAHAIHASGPRSNEAFLAVDCTSFTSALVQSQLFGHCKGAFTGANYEAIGCFRTADGGTIFLDEIGEIDFDLQARLLRVIQERVVVPLGSHREVPVNVRIIAATNRDLAGEVEAGRFREDLFYRLNVIHLHALPLADRPEDIAPLAEHFVHKLTSDGEFPRCALDPAAISALEGYDWPGNVRQLENVLERAVIASDEPVIGGALIARLLDAESARAWKLKPTQSLAPPSAICHTLPDGGPPVVLDEFAPVVVPPDLLAPDQSWSTLPQIERRYIELTLERTFYNQSAAARLLGVTRYALARKMKQLGIAGRRPPSRAK